MVFISPKLANIDTHLKQFNGNVVNSVYCLLSSKIIPFSPLFLAISVHYKVHDVYSKEYLSIQCIFSVFFARSIPQSFYSIGILYMNVLESVSSSPFIEFVNIIKKFFYLHQSIVQCLLSI